MHRTSIALLALTLTVSSVASLAGFSTGAAAAAPATPYPAAVSHPVEDSKYPTKGDPGIDTLHYGLDLTWLRQTRVLDGTATIVLRATHAADRFKLDLGAPLEVTALTVGGTDADFTHVGKTLQVNRHVARGSVHSVKVTYRGTPKPARAPTSRPDVPDVGWHTNKDGQVWAMQEPFGAFTWYPSNDQPSDKALYDVRIDVPAPWIGVSNGEMTGRSTANGRTVTTFHNHAPMSSYLLTIAIGPYKHEHQTGPHGLPIDYWVPSGHPGLMKPLRQTPAAIRWLEGRLGRYPFDRAGVVVTPSDSAMETQTMVTLGRANYQFGNRYIRQTMVHELAHSWYGDTVTPRDWRDLWMNEGMASYVDTRWAVDKGYTTWGKWQRQWRRDDQSERSRYGPPGDYKRGEFGSINVYYCTALMLDRLRIKIGTREFNRLVRAWPQTHRNSNQTRSSFVSWWENRSGKELSAFFHLWLMSRKSPA